MPCKESEKYLSHTASQGDFMVSTLRMVSGASMQQSLSSDLNHRHCLGPVDVGKAAVHHRKPPFFALGSKKLLVWLPAPVREFSQSGATEGEEGMSDNFWGLGMPSRPEEASAWKGNSFWRRRLILDCNHQMVELIRNGWQKLSWKLIVHLLGNTCPSLLFKFESFQPFSNYIDSMEPQF